MNPTKDALGYELVIGGTYGYSTRDNGVVGVTLGKLVKITEKRVTLKTKQYRAAYGINPTSEDPYFEGDLVHVIPNTIFRLKHLES